MFGVCLGLGVRLLALADYRLVGPDESRWPLELAGGALLVSCCCLVVDSTPLRSRFQEGGLLLVMVVMITLSRPYISNAGLLHMEVRCEFCNISSQLPLELR